MYKLLKYEDCLIHNCRPPRGVCPNINYIEILKA